MPWGAKEIVEGTTWGRGNSAEIFGIHLATSASAASVPGDKRARRVLLALFVVATEEHLCDSFDVGCNLAF